MKNTILEIIKQNPITFDEIYNNKEISSQIKKSELSDILKSFQSENKIIEVEKTWIHIEKLERKQGIVHWNLNNLCWIEDKDTTNSYGIAFNPQENLNLVFNKKMANMKSEVEYVSIDINDRKINYITDVVKYNPVNLLIAKKNRDWVIINTQFNSTIYDEDIEHIDGIKEFNKNDIIELEFNNGLYFKRFIGNIADKAIEAKVTQTLAELAAPPTIENISSIPNYQKNNSEFITIDSKSTTDIDDAVHFEKIGNQYHLQVAIADVSSFIAKGSPEDNHASKVATTFYLNGDKVPMFDKQLSDDRASLNIGEDKPALICHMIFDENANIINYEFKNQTINVKYKISYKDVDNILSSNPTHESYYIDENSEVKDLIVTEKLKYMFSEYHDFVKKIKKEELEKTYWFIESNDLKLDENLKVKEIYHDESRNLSPAQYIVENSMLKANICAAQFLRDNYPYVGLFRNQTKPVDNDKPKSATYENINEGHWGLQENTYTHFTSPIRRFCDLLCHRLIKNKINPDFKDTYNQDEIKTISENLNIQQYKSKQISIREKSMLLGQYIEKIVGDSTISSKYTLIDYSDKGIVIRNKQLIEVFLPYFKVDRELATYLMDNPNETREKQNYIDHANNNWQIKCFIDFHEWHQDRKNTEIKIYPKTDSIKKIKP